MKVLLFFLSFIILFSGCSEDERLAKFKFEIKPSNPSIIFKTRPLNYPLPVGSVTITGPWMIAGFNIVNENDRTITIVSAEFRVSALDGEVKSAEVFIPPDSNLPPEYDQNNFGVFKAALDLNCDGIVSELDVPGSEPDPETNPCLLDRQNPTSLGLQIYIYDLLKGVTGDAVDAYRGGTFNFDVRLEGWFGGPDSPEESFFKVVSFQVDSNG